MSNESPVAVVCPPEQSGTQFSQRFSGEGGFFDNLQVVHTRGPLVEETHYYPFGLIQKGISSRALNLSKATVSYKFNGIESNDDLEINTYDAFYRNMDPQIGRFWEIDPVTSYYESPYVMMGNNPILMTDWLGNYFTFNQDSKKVFEAMQAENSQRAQEYWKSLLGAIASGESDLEIKALETLFNKHAEISTQWEEMDKSDVEFVVSVGSTTTKNADGSTSNPAGLTVYNETSNSVDITLNEKNGKTSENLSHELSHAYEYLSGGAVGTSGNKPDPLNSLAGEINARNVGYLFLDKNTTRLVAQGHFNQENFLKYSRGKEYDHLKTKQELLTLNSPAALLLKYANSYERSFIMRNLNNANLTIRDVFNAVNELDRKAGRKLTYIFGDDLKNRK